MRHLRYLPILGLAALGIGCGGSVESGAGGVDFSAIVIERTECYGTCPVYSLTVTSRGNVTFAGEKHVATLSASSVVSLERVRALEWVLAASEFDRLIAQKSQPCRSPVTDFPSVRVEVQRNGSLDAVSAYLGCEPSRYKDAVNWIADSVDFLTESAAWAVPPAAKSEPLWIDLEKQE